MKTFWMAFVYKPIYNAFFFLLWLTPGHYVGVAIIALTLLVRFAIYPLTLKSIKAQRAMKELDPKIKALKEKHKDDKTAQSMAMMELYKQENVSPMSGCLPLLIQIPVISTLFFVLKGIAVVNTDRIYSFTPHVAQPNLYFLGLDLAGTSIILALLVGATQFYSTHLSMGVKTEKAPLAAGEKPSFADDFQDSMQMNMRYFLPALLAFTAYKLSAAVALYWVTSNMFTIGQELLVKYKSEKKVKGS
jgi:YidC/Oxa1 family membrane protein insertase